MDIEDIKTYITENCIVTTKSSDKNGLLATAVVTIGGVFRIGGFTIRSSKFEHPTLQDKVWIQPPQAKIGDTFREIVFFEDKELWREIEEIIYRSYLSKNE